MNIMIGINDKYLFPAKVMITSLCCTNKFEQHVVYLLYDRENLSSKSINSLKELELKLGVQIIPIQITADTFADCPVTHHFSIETYFRFMAQDVLPLSVDRVLWLDVDIIVNGSIKDFYYKPFENKSIIVCRTNNSDEKGLLSRLGLEANSGYFNAGVILFNLTKIRKHLSIRDYLSCLEVNRERILWLDQDVLNLIYSTDKVLINSQDYNFTFESSRVFSKEELSYIQNKIPILHYIGVTKPWHPEYQNPLGRRFRKYARKVWSIQDSIKFEGNRIRVRMTKKVFDYVRIIRGRQ